MSLFLTPALKIKTLLPGTGDRAQRLRAHEGPSSILSTHMADTGEVMASSDLKGRFAPAA